MKQTYSFSSIENLDFSGKFKEAYEVLNSADQNLFITGKAGTGKSSLLRYFVENTDKNVVVLASTGIASLNVGGETVHSFFRFRPVVITDKEIHFRSDRVNLYRSIDLLIIDEISTVRSDLLDGVDRMLRKHRNAHLPFGGVQVALFGDPFQLKPVVPNGAIKEYFEFNYVSPYFFDSNAYQSGNFQEIVLDKVFRQKDMDFIEVLDAVRTGDISDCHLDILNTRYNHRYEPPDGEPVVTLTCTNKQAEAINNWNLKHLDDKEFIYHCATTGKAFSGESKHTPAERHLRLRKGAQVMFLKNSEDRTWVNGTLGVVSDLDDNQVSVEVSYDDHSYVYNVPRTTWEVGEHVLDAATKKIDYAIVGSFTQYPLKHAWAITIHKSQGLTFEKVIVDFGRGAFDSGQAYVALSRSTSLEGLVLKKYFNTSNVLVAPQVKKFYEEAISKNGGD